MCEVDEGAAEIQILRIKPDDAAITRLVALDKRLFIKSDSWGGERMIRVFAGMQG